MKYCNTLILLAFLFSCHFKSKSINGYQNYFDDSIIKIFQRGINACQNENYKLADSLLSIVINKSDSKFSLSMPEEMNPYFYRANAYLNLGKYSEAIADMRQVASD